MNQKRAFTLLEMLLVMATIAMLAALLLIAVSGARAKARGTACANLLRQTGLALQMYVQDYGSYPPLAEKHTTTLCFDRLYPYYPVCWTNGAWNCPAYLAANGIISRNLVMSNSIGISYSYNYLGIVTGWPHCPRSIFHLRLGLGPLPQDTRRETGVLVPSEMYAVADARPEILTNGPAGLIKMLPWAMDTATREGPPPHGTGYNIAFCDGHVSWVRRSDYLYPPRTAVNWNSDHQQHSEAWAPASMWAVQK